MALPSLQAIAKGTLSALVAAFLAACASAGGLYGAIPGDNRPHAAVDRARSMPIQGIDVARYQENVDFRTASAAGTRFVFMKATEGKDYLDPNFRVNWQRAREAGMPRGAYHFMTWCSLASEQAAWFVANVPNDPDALPPVLDLEWNQSSKSCPGKIGAEEALSKIDKLLEVMEAHTGKRPIIYTDIAFHRDVLKGRYKNYEFWLRSVAAEPYERFENRPWTFWQYTATGRVAGIKGAVDRNAFNGSPKDWQRWLQRQGVTR